MRLLSGPPGSDATSLILAELRQALSRAAPNVRLLTPTATMAEHLRHQVAREGFVFQPGLIQTLSSFVAPWTEDLPQVTSAALYLIVESVARRLARPEFARVLGAPGFYAALAQTVEEFSAAGCDAERLARALPWTPFGPAFVAIYGEVERELACRGMGLRAARLERAAGRIAAGGLPDIDTVWIDGFFTFTDSELAVIRALSSHADLTITLPDASGLAAIEFEERRVESRGPAPAAEAFSAPTIDREAEEIALRVLAAGGAFRDIGVIVRNPDVYVAPLRAAFERFGIPARFYFPGPLADHGTIRCLSSIVDAQLSGWDHAATLAALRLTGSSPALDAFDFAVREKLPGAGLDGLRELTDDPPLLRILSGFDALSAPSQLTPSQWSEHLASLRNLIPSGGLAGRIPHETALLLRSQAAALNGFEAALDEAARFLGDSRRIPLAEFWSAVQSILRLTQLRVPDQRRNVVHVLSVFEARQWELPCVFICGLTDREFPKRATPNPLFPDSALVDLATSGVRLRAAAEREAEERFLFELAATRATGRLTLSYPEVDSRGVRNTPSPFLKIPVQRSAILARPLPTAPAADPVASPAAVLRNTFSATGLDTYLDCPFQFFSRYTLRLAARPLAPQDRLDFLLQGTIIHQALAEWHQNPQPIEPLFERIFAAACDGRGVSCGYKTENLRRQMLEDLRHFCDSGTLPAAAEILTERQFEIPIGDILRLRGRIDRVDKLDGGRALIVDYKYSAAPRVAARMTKESLLQGGLYALAVERELGLQPVGVLYYGLKKELKVVGWTDPPGAFGVKTEPLTANWIAAAEARAIAAAGEIRAGRIEPDPADPEICRLCEFRDVCRFEGAAQALGAENPGA